MVYESYPKCTNNDGAIKIKIVNYRVFLQWSVFSEWSSAGDRHAIYGGPDVKSDVQSLNKVQRLMDSESTTSFKIFEKNTIFNEHPI